MDAYVTGAFVRFARRALVRDAFWFRHLGAEPEEMGAAPMPEFDPIDQKRLRAAVMSLSTNDQALLRERYGREPVSERELARQHGWSRYAVRDKLARALVKVSCLLGDSGLLSERELQLANALFCDGRSVREAATTFNLTEPQVRQARTSILKAIGDALGGSS